MLMVAIALLQAAPAAEPTPAAQPVAAQEAAPAADEAPEMKMKKVCRKVIDPRVNTLAGRQTVCKYVPADDGKTVSH